MLIPIFIVLFVVLVVVGVYALILTSRDTDVKEWVADSVDAWRSDGLDVDDFELKVRDTSVEDVFAKFPAASEDYVTPDDVEENWNRMVSMEREASEYVKAASAPVVEKVAGVASRVRKQDDLPGGDDELTEGYADEAPASPTVALDAVDESDTSDDAAESNSDFAKIFTSERSAESHWPGDAPQLTSETEPGEDSRAA